MCPKNLGQNNFGPIKLGPKKFLVRKEIFKIKLRSEKKFGLKKLLVRKNFRFNKIAGPKILGLKKILVSKNILVHKNYDPQKLGPKIWSKCCFRAGKRGAAWQQCCQKEIFLGRAVARALISGFVIPSACGPACHS